MTSASLVLLLAPSVRAVRRLPPDPGPAAVAAGDQDRRGRTGRAPDQVARP